MGLAAEKLSATQVNDKEQQRIDRMRERYQKGEAWLSVERARYFTESWDAQGPNTAPVKRVAEAMRNVYRNMTMYLDSDDRIAGYMTEDYLGIPIDIERGIFNDVLATELRKSTLIKARIKASVKGMSYMLKSGKLKSFLAEQKSSREKGSAGPLDIGLDTLQSRRVNAFQITAANEKELLKTLLPKWKGRTIADEIEKAVFSSGLSSEENTAFAMAIPGNTSRQVQMFSTAATIATIQGHVILDFASVLKKGLNGIEAEINSRRSNSKNTEDQMAYLDAALISLDGIRIYARRLSQRIEQEIKITSDEDRKKELALMLKHCKKVPFEPATSFREAVQSIWIIKTAVELAQPVNLHCFGRLDQDLNDYYLADFAVGKIDSEEAVVLLEELLLKVMSQNIRPESNLLGNFYQRFLGSSPITLAGTQPDGSDATNDLTYLFIEAAHRSKAVTNVSVRIAPSTPEKVLETIAGHLYNGTSSFSLYNDDTHIPAMLKSGFSEPDSRDYAIMGCVEATCPGKTGSMSGAAMLLSRVLDITLRGGDARTLAGLIKGEGKENAKFSERDFETFDELLEAFLFQTRYFIEKVVKVSNLRDQVFAEKLPAPLISIFIDGCTEKAADVTQKGGKYDLTGISFINSIANVTDSLLAIKHLVFQQGKYSLDQFRAAVDADYEGYEALLQDIKSIEGKWGNNNPESNALAAYIVEAISKETYKHRSYKDASVVPYMISITTHTIDGRLSIASPDGRRAATPYAAGANPYNVDKSGVTATLQSVAALPHEEIMGCAVNVRFHPTGIGHNQAARRKWTSLVRTYFRLGGAQLQPTVAGAETLAAAQKDPDTYRDLIVKVGGYSTYFVDLGREIQDEIISRTEHR